MLTCVVPCYNEEAVLNKFIEKITETAEEMSSLTSFEFLFIDDGSKDKTLDIIKAFALRDRRVRYISFSRNFGKEAGILAGLKYAKGDYVVLMDADLQHPPAMLKQMFEAVTREGYDCCGTRRVSRKGEPGIRSAFSTAFYKLMSKFAKSDIQDGAQDFQMMNRKYVDAVLSLAERSRFSKGIFSWVGFNKKWIECENAPRAAGKTKWSFSSLFMYALDGFFSFTTAPLMLTYVFGALFCAAAVLLIIGALIFAAVSGSAFSGTAAVCAAVLFVGGVQLVCAGIFGQYIGKIYLETKDRPVYIINETNTDKR